MAQFSSSSPPEARATVSGIFGYDEDLPTARLISSTDQGSLGAVSLTPEYGVVVEDAVAIPSGEDIYSGARTNERLVTDLATHRGRMMAEQELEDIQRANVNVRAQNYFARAAVDEANRAARNRIQLDDGNKHTTTTDFSMEAEKLIAKQINGQKQTPAIQGTFGKDYEVSDYDVSDYDTKDYDISTYKSVYES